MSPCRRRGDLGLEFQARGRGSCGRSRPSLAASTTRRSMPLSPSRAPPTTCAGRVSRSRPPRQRGARRWPSVRGSTTTVGAGSRDDSRPSSSPRRPTRPRTPAPWITTTRSAARSALGATPSTTGSHCSSSRATRSSARRRRWCWRSGSCAGCRSPRSRLTSGCRSRPRRLGSPARSAPSPTRAVPSGARQRRAVGAASRRPRLCGGMFTWLTERCSIRSMPSLTPARKRSRSRMPSSPPTRRTRRPADCVP